LSFDILELKKIVVQYFVLFVLLLQSSKLSRRKRCWAGLPDGIFLHQKFQFWYTLKALERNILVYFIVILVYFIVILVYFIVIKYIFCGHSLHFMAFWHILWTVWYGFMWQEKSGNPAEGLSSAVDQRWKMMQWVFKIKFVEKMATETRVTRLGQIFA
jgi:hypothetical protein